MLYQGFLISLQSPQRVYSSGVSKNYQRAGQEALLWLLQKRSRCPLKMRFGSMGAFLSPTEQDRAFKSVETCYFGDYLKKPTVAEKKSRTNAQN